MASRFLKKFLLLTGITMTLVTTPYCRKDKKEQSPQQISKPGDPPNGWDGTSDWTATGWEIIDE